MLYNKYCSKIWGWDFFLKKYCIKLIKGIVKIFTLLQKKKVFQINAIPLNCEDG